ncbi:MAG: bifunctional diaminohydroxyphosphoribosylaminopyrimidine deaminase/5-amino-6-(5-phosphoribosylamino)uracil reductase RibD [Candidatus Pelagibacter sp.]
MSLKKDSYSNFDKNAMKLAIRLAINNNGLTGTNPSVGCVIAKNNRIISYAATGINGRPHAETIAIKNSKDNYKSVIYITLEPCSHYGKTPPCTKTIIKSGLKKVNFSVSDIDPRSSNKSKKILKANKIITKSGLLRNEVKKLYKSYSFTKRYKLPYITGKLACASNFYILKNRSNITNEHSRKLSHLLRYKNQGIMTSFKTVNSDNPKLTCRLNGLEKFSPSRFIIDKNLKINMNSFIVNNSKKIKTFVFHNSKNKEKIKKLKEKGLKLIKQESNINGQINIKKLFKKIYSLGIHSLLVECGKNLTSNILTEGLFNEFYLFKSNKAIKSLKKINVKNIYKMLNQNYQNKNNVKTYLDKDILIHYS